MSLERLLEGGKILQLRIRFWDGKVKLVPEDVGFFKDDLPFGSSLGVKPLIPGEEMKGVRSAVAKARSLAERFGVKFDMMPGTFWVDKDTLPVLVGLLEIAKQDLDKEVQKLLSRYRTFKMAMRPAIVSAAHQAHQRVVFPRRDPSMSWYSQFISRVEDSYPPEADVASKYGIDFLVFRLSLEDVGVETYDRKIREEMVPGFQAEILGRPRKQRLWAKDRLRSSANSLNVHDSRRVPPGALKQIHEFIRDYRLYDLFGDVLLKDKLEKLKTYLDTLALRDLKESEELRYRLAEALRALALIAEDEAQIRVLEEGYITRLGIKPEGG